MARHVLAATMVLTSLVAYVRTAEASDDVAQVAAATGVDEQDLRGAVNTVGVSPREYLQHEGVLPPPGEYASQAAGTTLPSRLPAVASPRIECIVHYESGGDPNAYSRSSGAAGLGQFRLGTWMSTPQGRAGLSRYAPAAARAAMAWMLSQGRAREWVPVQKGLC